MTAGETTYTVADVPGLIEGASEGRGLGHEFLRHVERCAALVHVVDTATMEPGRNPVDDLAVIENELSRYGGLEDRPRLVALNKIDVPDGRGPVRHRHRRPARAGPAGLPGQRRLGRGAARAHLRDGRDRRRGPGGQGRRRDDPDRAPPAVRRRWRRLHGGRDRRWAGRCAAPSPSAGCGRPTSATTRRSASSPTGSTGSGSRPGCSSSGPRRATPSSSATRTTPWSSTSSPGIDAGAENLGRRGEDTRLMEERPAVGRRRAIQEAHGRPRRG